MWILFGFGVVHFVTQHWYTAIYKCIFAVLGISLAPKYSRLSGFYFKSSERSVKLDLKKGTLFGIFCFLRSLDLVLEKETLHLVDVNDLPSFMSILPAVIMRL